MTDTVRELIIKAITTRAAALSAVPVLRTERSIGETADRFVSVWDGADQAQGVSYGKQTAQFTVAIEIIKATVNHSTEANAIIGEAIALFLGTNRTYNGLALKTEYVGATPAYPQDGSNYTTITLLLNITYETVLGDPFTQITP